MTPPKLSATSIALGLALACVGHAWAQTPAGAPSNAQKGVITPVTQPIGQPMVQPPVKPQVQTSTLPKSTKTWDYKRHHPKTVTGVISPVPVPVQPTAQPYPVPQPGHGHCPPGLGKKNNGCLPPGHAK